MPLCRLTGVTAFPRSISSVSRRAATPAIPCFQPHLNIHSNFHLSSKVLQCQFSSTASRSASARFAPRPPSLRPASRPNKSSTHPEVEADIYPPMPEGALKEPGSGLTKLFLAITIPILILTHSNEIARKTIPPDDVRKALNLDPDARPSPAAYDYYIYNNKPDHAKWLRIGELMKRNFSFVPANFAGNTPGEPFRWWTLLTPEFNHGSILHLFFCYTALKAFVPPLVQVYGGGVTTACFVVGGVVSHTLVGFYEKTTNPLLKMSPAEIKQRSEVGFTSKEKKRFHNAYSWHMGSSASLMTLGM